MQSRKEKLEEMIQGFETIRKNMVFSKISAMESAITPSQWMALRIIHQHNQISIKKVAEELCITSSAASQLIDGLVRSGYVIRKEGSLDKRFVIVTLSQNVKKQVDNLKKHIIEHLLLMFDTLNDKEFNQYCLLNKKIVNHITKKHDNIKK